MLSAVDSYMHKTVVIIIRRNLGCCRYDAYGVKEKENVL